MLTCPRCGHRHGGGLCLVTLHIPTSADVEQRDVELDHAVALERNRIADWLEAVAVEEDRQSRRPRNRGTILGDACRFEAMALRRAAQAIRNCDHWRAS